MGDITSSIQPAMQTFNRLMELQTEASRHFILLPAEPGRLPIFIGCLLELYRIPRAILAQNKDIVKDELGSKLKNLRDEAYSETERFLNAYRENNRDYRYNLELHRRLDDAYDEVYDVLAKAKLLTPTESSIDLRKALSERASE